MRSRSSALACLLLAAAAACGTDAETTCQTSYLTYASFGEAYMTTWCRGCHSADLPPSMRQLAPPDVNFDTLAEVQAQLLPIQTSIANATMPPEGGPSAQDQQQMMQWLSCGAP